MENYFMAILKLLNVIHWENKVIVSCMLDKDKSKDVCKKMDKVFDDVINDFNNNMPFRQRRMTENEFLFRK